MHSDPSAIVASSRAFSSTPTPQPIPNGFLGLVIGSAPVELFCVLCILVLDGGLACVFFACIYFLAAFWVACVCNGSIGCTNNNYASREKCKKCGQPKELAAMPAVAIPGASVPTHPTYFARARGGMEQMVNVGSLQPSISLNPGWSVGGTSQYGNQTIDPYGLQSVSNWPLGGGSIPGISYSSQTNQLHPVPNGNGWRTGDWMCTCGFHNYSSRFQCKKCNAPASISAPPSLVSPVTALGTKRLASEEFVHNLDNKRLNAGQAYVLHQPSSGLESFQIPGGIYPPIPSGNTPIPPNWQVNLQLSHLPPTPTLVGKGSKQWRDGDWMCSNCNNHNYASREQCNRCKTTREVTVQPVSVA